MYDHRKESELMGKNMAKHIPEIMHGHVTVVRDTVVLERILFGLGQCRTLPTRSTVLEDTSLI